MAKAQFRFTLDFNWNKIVDQHEVTVIMEALADVIIRSSRIPLRGINFYLRGEWLVDVSPRGFLDEATGWDRFSPWTVSLMGCPKKKNVLCIILFLPLIKFLRKRSETQSFLGYKIKEEIWIHYKCFPKLHVKLFLTIFISPMKAVLDWQIYSKNYMIVCIRCFCTKNASNKLTTCLHRNVPHLSIPSGICLLLQTQTCRSHRERLKYWQEQKKI